MRIEPNWLSGGGMSDSMEYEDEELAELHAKREKQMLQYVEKKAQIMKMAMQERSMMPCSDRSDEDTDDASEDGENTYDPPQEIKEQVYFDKLALLKQNLEELDTGNYPEYRIYLRRLDIEKLERKQKIEAWKEYELSCIERDYNNERMSIAREFEEKKIELRESLISELEEKKKQIEMERYSIELTADPTDVKPMSTRKLRRRPNDPLPLPEKRRKTPQSQITFLLDEKEIDDDLKAIHFGSKRKSSEGYRKGGSADSTDYVPDNQHLDTRIEDGKLFYEKKWFHRGQQVYVEGKDLPKTSGVICSISQDLVWVRKVSDQSKVRVSIAHLQKGKTIIKRRA